MHFLVRSLLMIGASLWVAAPCVAETATYRLTVENRWSESSHPGAFPDDAHFSWLGGATLRFQRVGAEPIPALGPVASWTLGAALLAAASTLLRRRR
jgi:hypothetical protein